ncbi:MAG TPA: DUF983 domain-containing protein [Novosphingobium sp.]|nr:DUF983 domain-containing protein [Novosphingobium sp.]
MSEALPDAPRRGFNWAVWLPLALGLCLGLMRPLKGLMIALQSRHRRSDFRGPG